MAFGKMLALSKEKKGTREIKAILGTLAQKEKMVKMEIVK